MLQIEIRNLLVNLFSSGLLTKHAIKIYLYILSLYISRCHFLNLKIDCMCCIKCLWAGEEGDIWLTWNIRKNLKYARAKYTDKHAARGENELKCIGFSLISTLNASRMVIPNLLFQK